MLKEQDSTRGPTPNIPEHRLWQDELRHPSLGCWNCPERQVCGGLSVAARLMDCLDLCCNQPDKCDRPCRKNPDYALRVREVGGFPLDNIPRAPIMRATPLPLVVPILFHGSRRNVKIGPEPIALPLYAMFTRREGRVRFETHEELCAAFGLVPGTPIILTGTDQDPPLERWWGYEDKRRKIIRELKKIGIILATTPNYSLFVDVPRHVDLHAIKRIGLVHSEFLEEGLPTALHINGRTETDFRRWGEYVRARPEITYLAYEFTTGSSRAARREMHVDWLIGVAANAGRPLNLIMRGGIDLLLQLAPAFDQITVLETWSFMKTMKRQRASLRKGLSPRWRPAPSAVGTPLDILFAANRSAVRCWIEEQAALSSLSEGVAAGE